MTVAYMYNPFKGEVFRKVMANIVASLDRRPREVRLVYLLPSMDTLVQETGRFKAVRRERFGEGDQQEIAFYTSGSDPAVPRVEQGAALGEQDGCPVQLVEVTEEQLEQVDSATRRTFIHVARGLEEIEFFGREGPPPKEWAQIDLDQYEDFDEFIKACRKVHSGNAVRDARKAADRGYYSKFFDYQTFVGDVVDIDNSAPARQGGEMAAHYRRSVEERGGYVAEYHEVTPPGQTLAWDRFFGVFCREPGHKQGEVVVSERLLSYIKFRRLGPFSFYGTILGHADHLREGVMYKMHLDLIELLLRNRTLLRAGDDSADYSLAGLRFVGYARFFGQGSGLEMWKKRMLFKPGYFLIRYPSNEV
jgi:hypothetical protein